jgi:hypothetical protein
VLLALYELGHGIYPAAYLTKKGTCARYAYALGIGACSLKNKRKVLTRVEIEEQRVWWSIVILDQFVSIGSPGRPFAAAEPQFDDILPTDDDLWHEGVWLLMLRAFL